MKPAYCLLTLLLASGSLFSASSDLGSRNWSEMRKQVERTLHITRPLRASQPIVYGTISPAPGVLADRVSYVTEYGLRVPAIVYHEEHPNTKKHPALVIVNGHRGDKSSWYAYWAGLLYARAGAIVLTYDPIGEFERNKERLSRSNEHDAYIPPDEMAERLSGLMVTDVMQGVSYLRKRHDVDKNRIAVLGYSMGSFVSALTCAIDTRIRACVLVGGGDLDGPNGYWDGSNKMCQGIPYRSLRFLGNRGAALYALNAKRGPTLIFNGSDDQVVDIPHHDARWFERLRQQTTDRLGSAKNVFEFGFQPGGGHRPYFLTKPVALWLEDKLNFPEWTRQRIEAMGETHIAEWISQQHLATERSPDFEHHEGGTLALGEAMPAVSRHLLHAIPESFWGSNFRSFVYETWVERAKAAIRSEAP